MQCEGVPVKLSFARGSVFWQPRVQAILTQVLEVCGSILLVHSFLRGEELPTEPDVVIDWVVLSGFPHSSKESLHVKPCMTLPTEVMLDFTLHQPDIDIKFQFGKLKKMA